MRLVRRVLAVGALGALVAVGAPSAGAQTPTVTSVIGSADGLFADIEVEILDIDSEEVEAQQVVDFLTFGPEPTVAIPPTGGSVSEQVVGVQESVELLSLTADLVTAAAEGALGPDGFATAESTVADVELVEVIPPSPVGAQQLEDPILAAELISATCSSDLTGVSGSTTLVGATVLGEDISGEPAPNTSFQVGVVNGFSATIGVTLNGQVQNPDGSLSVTPLALDIDIDLEFATITGTVQVGPATCGVVEEIEVPVEPLVPVPAEPLTVTPRFTG